MAKVCKAWAKNPEHVWVSNSTFSIRYFLDQVYTRSIPGTFYTKSKPDQYHVHSIPRLYQINNRYILYQVYTRSILCTFFTRSVPDLYQIYTKYIQIPGCLNISIVQCEDELMKHCNIYLGVMTPAWRPN